MIFRLLDDVLVFPDTALAEPDGLLAIGGDLSTERLQLAYQSGIFPWFSKADPILWYAPHQRCVVFPERVKVSKSMAKTIRDHVFEVTVNRDFEKVIKNCAQVLREGQDGTWITHEMQVAYILLHQKGLAHSIEVWHEGQLVGGLYGIRVNKVFCGESMFSLMSNASKRAFIYLCKDMDFEMIDCQLPNEHLMSLGAEMISRETYLEILQPTL